VGEKLAMLLRELEWFIIEEIGNLANPPRDDFQE
jgi:hypothetical protein